MSEDRRLKSRIPLKTYAFLASEGSSIELETIDISIGGLCIRSSQQLIVGQSYDLAFDVLLNGNTRRIATLAEVAYSIFVGEFYKTGLRFIEMDNGSTAILEEFTDS